MYSTAIKQLLTEIEDEATRPNSRPKPSPKNFMKENYKRLKDIQEQAKKKDAEKQHLKPLRAVYQYSQVQSKVSNMVNGVSSKEDGCVSALPPRTANSCRSRCQRPPNHGGPYSGNKLVPSKSLPQLSNVKQDQQWKHEEDTSTEGSLQGFSPSKQKKAPHQLGHIPAYLIERKKEWQREKERQIKLLEEASIPAGHTLLPDSERVETLELLIKNREELLQTLASLPVRNDTLRLRKFKEEHERQLAKVEEAIKIFSRQRVLIKNDT